MKVGASPYEFGSEDITSEAYEKVIIANIIKILQSFFARLPYFSP